MERYNNMYGIQRLKRVQKQVRNYESRKRVVPIENIWRGADNLGP